MNDIIALVVLFAVVFVLLPFILKKFNITPSVPSELPYHTKYILTPPEYSFYNALKPLMDEHSYLICPKVGLKDLFEVNKGSNRQKYFGMIRQKHIDFLICDSKLRPLFAIELDDKSHNRQEVKERDEFKDLLFKSAGLPLYRVPTTASYNPEYIKTSIKFLQPNQNP